MGIAQQALLTTQATGAAIALSEGPEIVCRATTGLHAPDLGARLDTKSGLSGACVQSRRVQICSDTELDPRVDVEACRALGVRSILVAPLLYQDALVGVMELFSPVVHCFGEADIQTLEACGRRILEAMGKSENLGKREEALDVARVRDHKLEPMRAPEHIRAVGPPPGSESSAVIEPARVIEPPASLLAQAADYDAPRRQRDLVTTALTGLVIGLAILFGSLLGLRMSRRQVVRLPAAEPAPQAADAVSSTPEAQANPEPPAVVEPSRPTRAGLIDPARKVEGADDKAGGLVVYQNDRVVFQLPPSKTNLAQTPVPTVRSEGTVTLSPEVAGKLLSSRVEPQYPDQALAAHIQGSVSVRVTVDQTGKVQRARVFSGPPELAQAAVDAVKQWTFQPYAPDGTPRDFETTAIIDFKLP